MTDIAISTVQQALIDCGVKPVYVGDTSEFQLECCVIRPVSGYPNTMYFGNVYLQEPLLEVVIRQKSYAEGQELYNIALDLLSAYYNFDAGIRHCNIVGSPGFLGRSAAGFCEWVFMAHLTLDASEEENEDNSNNFRIPSEPERP